MKDLEKIKSEDLGCQVQDANPGNFAIEQEVAQLVGATVPAPTEPSADDARELGAQLLVFLRRALTPIQTALRTAVAAIYAHLDSRCTDYTPAAYDPFRLPAGPYDPMRPFVPRTLPNLLTALTAFSARKISGVPEAADGVSLVHQICNAATANEVLELTDNTEPWIYNRHSYVQTLCSLFPYMTKVTMNCKEINSQFWATTNDTVTKVLEVFIYGCEKITSAVFPTTNNGGRGFPNVKLHIYGFTNGANLSSNPHVFEVGELYFPDYEKGTVGFGGPAMYDMNTVLTKLYVGCKGKKTDTAIMSIAYGPKYSVTDIEIGDGACQNISFIGFGGPTAENMYNHILLRLKQDEPLCGSGVTITLGTTNIEKLEAVEEYNTLLTELEDVYGYTFA